MELTAIAEELYGLPPEEFTRTRNERAKQARAEDRSLAARVAKLAKPSTAAWVVNMLVRHMGEELEQVLTLGASLREAQDNLDGAQLRELNKQRRQLTSAVTVQARGVAQELGVKVSEAVATQVEETLRAAMTDEAAASAVRTGQLLEALSATGLEELDVSSAVAVPESIGLTARPVERPKPALTVVEDRADPDDGAAERRRARALEEAQEAAEEARLAERKAGRKLAKAHKRVAELEARSLQLQGELEELRRRMSEVEHALEHVDDELTEAEEKQERAETRQAKAARALEEAEGEVKRRSD